MYKQGLLGLLAVLLVACTVSPTGRPQLTMLPPQQLASMGETAFRQIRESEQVETDRRINDYVRCVTQAIVAGTDRPQDWQVLVIRNETSNAFALPSGKIGVHTGLLEVTQNQHQLATVIGHEMAHVLADHHNERLSQDLAVQGGISVVGALLGNYGTATQQQMMGLLGLGAQMGILLPYSRVQEREADIVGLDLIAQVGFDPRQSLALWENMERAGNARSPEFLSTHPSYGTRMRDLETHMDSALQAYQAARAQGREPRCDRYRPG